MSKTLYQRTWRVQIGNVDVSDLDIEFSVEKSTKREPNTCVLKVWNLSPDKRSRIETEDDLTVYLRAGYKADGDPPPVLFVGDVRRAFSEVDGVDMVTTIEARDKGRAYQQARLNKSYGPGTSIVQVLRDAVDALGIGRGNLDDFSFSLTNGSRNFNQGYVASGQAHRVVSNLLRGSGYRFSVQNGALQIMRRGQPLQLRAVLLSPSSGLIESPTKGDKGTVTARSLIQPGLEPGRRIKIESRLIDGSFEIRKVKYDGNTKGNDWYATVECKAV